MKDKNNKTIKIGDIVRIEQSPIQSDNSLYIVVQDGTSNLYSDRNSLTLYKVNKYGDTFTLSKTKYNICFYPLCNTSNRYKFTRQELDAATIEIIKESDPSRQELKKANNDYEPEPQAQDYFTAIVYDKNGERIEDVSYLCNQSDKLCAFFSNLTVKPGQHIEIVKINHQWSWHYRQNGIKYQIELI